MAEEQVVESTGTAPVPNAGTSEEVTAFDPAFKENGDGTGASDTPKEGEQGAETDEQKNARLAEKSRQRSERRQETFNSRISELTAERYAERARADAAERRAADLQAQFQQRGSAPNVGTNEPQRSQYTDWESYVEARAEWRAATAFQRMAAQAAAEGAQANQIGHANAQLGEMQRTIKNSVTEFVKTHPDYHDVVESHDVDVPIPATLAIGVNKDAAAIMYHLGQNPDLVESLQTMSPIQQATTIGEIAATVRTSPQVSRAPAPGRPVGSKPGSEGSPPEDTAAYMAWADKYMK